MTTESPFRDRDVDDEHVFDSGAPVNEHPRQVRGAPGALDQTKQTLHVRAAAERHVQAFRSGHDRRRSVEVECAQHVRLRMQLVRVEEDEALQCVLLGRVQTRTEDDVHGTHSTVQSVSPAGSR